MRGEQGFQIVFGGFGRIWIPNNIRIGGKMKFKKFWGLFLTAALSFSLAVTPVMADEVSDLQDKVNDLKDQKEQVEGEVNSLQTELENIMTRLSELENDLIATGEEITQTQADLEQAQEEEEQQYEAMKLRIKYMYEAGSGSATVEKVLASGDMTSVLTQAEYSEQVHTYDRQKLEEYAATVQKVEDLKTSLEEKQAQLEDSQAEFEAKQDELNTTISEKSSEIDDLDVQIEEAAKKAEEAARKKAEEEARRKAAEEAARRAAEEEAARQDAASNSNSDSEEDNGSSGGGGQTYVPDYNQSKGEIIVDAAYSQLGVPYVWGGSTPYVGLDCSGLVQWCYRQAGISIPRTSGAIMSSGTIVSNPQPGDICWKPGHVAIYIGNGKMIEAPHTGAVVRVANVRVTYYIRY